jgi:hypothetical protein
MKRVQRKRTKGFRLPENTKCVNRGTKWGNPFKVVQSGNIWTIKDKNGIQHGGTFGTKDEASAMAVHYYSGWVDKKIASGDLDLKELKGKNLACFCSLTSPCHADYLLKLVETEAR